MCSVFSSAQERGIGGPRVHFGTMPAKETDKPAWPGHWSSVIWGYNLLHLDVACAGPQVRFFSCAIVIGILSWSSRPNTNPFCNPPTVTLLCLSLGCFPLFPCYGQVCAL